MFVFWRDVARRWGIDVPEEQAEFRAWMEEYERTEYERTPEASALAVAMGDDFCRRFFPGPLKPIGYTVLSRGPGPARIRPPPCRRRCRGRPA